ncbi:MAG: hypothetical protein LQ340_006266, partial [Diploschistes diacapsis]
LPRPADDTVQAKNVKAATAVAKFEKMHFEVGAGEGVGVKAKNLKVKVEGIDIEIEDVMINVDEPKAKVEK